MTLLAPQTPLLFMGEEYGGAHAVPLLHRPHRPGDRRSDARGPAQEFARFAAFAGEDVPDPQDPVDVRALEARPHRAETTTCTRSTSGCCALRRSCPRDRRRRRRDGFCVRAAVGSTLVADFATRSGRSSPVSVLARRAVPSRRDLGRERHELLRSSPRTPSGSSSACSTTTTPRRGSSSPSARRSTGTATSPASARGSATRTASTARMRPSAGTASTTTSSCSTPTRRRSRARSATTARTRCRTSPTEAATPTSSRTRADDAAAIPKCVVIDPTFDWEGDQWPRTPWHETVIYEAHVKGFTKLNERVREDLRGTYAGPRVGGGDRVPHRPRRHGGRGAARAPHRRRAVPRRAWPDELLGLQLDRLLRTARAVRGHRNARRAGARVQGDGEGAPPRGDRGDPRRRLQPHRRGQPPRPDARVQGRRQRVATTG